MLLAQVAPLRNPCLQLLPMQLFPKMPVAFLLSGWSGPAACAILSTQCCLRQFLVVSSLLHFYFSTLKLALAFPISTKGSFPSRAATCGSAFYSMSSCSVQIQAHGNTGVWDQGCPALDWRQHHSPTFPVSHSICPLVSGRLAQAGQSRGLPRPPQSHFSLLCSSHRRGMGGSRTLRRRSVANAVSEGTK